MFEVLSQQLRGTLTYNSIWNLLYSWRICGHGSTYMLILSWVNIMKWKWVKMPWEFSAAQKSVGKVKHKLRVTSSNPPVTSSNSRVTSSNLRFTSSNRRVTKSNSRVTSSNPRVTSSNPRVRRLKARVARLKAWVGRLKAWVRRLKAPFGSIKPRVR